MKTTSKIAPAFTLARKVIVTATGTNSAMNAMDFAMVVLWEAVAVATFPEGAGSALPTFNS
jgi:hypothetical protein